MTPGILKAVLAGDYVHGLALFQASNLRCSEDLRWGGVCQMHLGNAVEAQRLLRGALSRGVQAARIELATCSRLEGDFAAAQDHLDLLDFSALGAMDAALALREVALIRQQRGHTAEAVRLLDQAWSHSVSAPLAVQSVVGQSIGLLASSLGDDVKAAAYLADAERHANPSRRVYIQLAQAGCRTYLGEFGQAERHLTSAEQLVSDGSTFPAALWQYRLGTWLRAQGRDDEAACAFRQSVSLAQARRQPETELFSQLGLAAIATAQAATRPERDALLRSRKLLSVLGEPPRAAAYVDWRLGAAQARQGRAEAVTYLTRALEFFQSQGSVREELWILLYLTEAQERLGLTAAHDTLRLAAETHTAAGGQQDLGPELRGLSHVNDRLNALGPGADEAVLRTASLAAVAVAEVALVTLGRSGIFVNGERTRLQMKKTVEVLTFLLQQGKARLSAIQGELFSDVSPQRSKNYIHQVRLELRRLVPGLSVPYDAADQTYRVQCNGVQLTWDVQSLQRQLTLAPGSIMTLLDSCGGDFLPESETEWAAEERTRLSRSFVRTGLETMHTWYRERRYDRCIGLAERLLEIDPLDETIHAFLIRATAELSGVTAACGVCWQSRALFIRETGSVPPDLDRLSRRIRGELVP